MWHDVYLRLSRYVHCKVVNNRGTNINLYVGRVIYRFATEQKEIVGHFTCHTVIYIVVNYIISLVLLVYLSKGTPRQVGMETRYPKCVHVYESLSGCALCHTPLSSFFLTVKHAIPR